MTAEIILNDLFNSNMSLVCRYAEFAQYEVDTDATNYAMTLIHARME